MIEEFNAAIARKLSLESEENHKPFLNKCLSEIKATAQTGKRQYDIHINAIPHYEHFSIHALEAGFKYTYDQLNSLGFKVSLEKDGAGYIPRSQDQETGTKHYNIYFRVTW